MYSPSVIAARAAALEAEYQVALRPYTVAETEDWVDRIDSIWNAEAKAPTRPLAKEEETFILNASLLCKVDYQYWAQRFCTINHEGTALKKLYPLYESQEFVLSKLAKLEAAEADGSHQDGFLLNVLKSARQVGVSTLAESLIAHRLATQTNIHALIARDVPGERGSGILFSMLLRALDNLPWWMRPAELLRREAGEQFLELAGDNRVIVGAGKSMQGSAGDRGQLGRGDTFSLAHLCVAGRTAIPLVSGEVVPISEVKAGMEIVTHRGNVARVSAAIRSRRSDEITSEIWPWGSCSPISTTRDHLILTSEGWKVATAIKPKDWLRYPVRLITHEVKTFETVTRWIGGSTQGDRPSTAKTFPLNRPWGYALGLYLAEGSLTWGKRNHDPHYLTGVCWSVDKDEVPEMQRRLVEACGRISGVSVAKDSRTRVIRYSQTGLARWINQEFGSKDTKRIPVWAWKAGREFCLGLVEGYLEGDGHWVVDANEICATSVRVQLTQQMRDIIASLGFGWSNILYKPSGVYYDRNCRAAWTLHVSGPTGAALRRALGKKACGVSEPKHWRWAEDGSIECEVAEVGDGFSENFYDLEIDSDDHSFCSLFGALHNSELSTWESAEQIDESLLPTIPRSPWSLVLFESTARGRGRNWWHQHWLAAKRGQSRFKNVFIPWYVEAKRYSLRPPVGWTPADHTAAVAKRIEETSPRWLEGRRYLPTRAQLYWYEFTRQTFVAKDNLRGFLENYGALDDDECFQMSGRGIFTPGELDQMQSRMRPVLASFEVARRADL